MFRKTKPKLEEMSLNIHLDPVQICTELTEFNIKDQVSVCRTIIHQSTEYSMTQNKTTFVSKSHITGISTNIVVRFVATIYIYLCRQIIYITLVACKNII